MSTGKTVLIVDDDRLVRQTLQQIVESMGHRAIVVERASRARRALDESPVDAMLLDLQMPGAQGDQLLQALKNRKLPVPPTVIISAHVHRDRLGPLIGLGVQGIIAKPFRVARVCEELQRILADGPVPPLTPCAHCGAASTSGGVCPKCDKPLEGQDALSPAAVGALVGATP